MRVESEVKKLKAAMHIRERETVDLIKKISDAKRVGAAVATTKTKL